MGNGNGWETGNKRETMNTYIKKYQQHTTNPARQTHSLQII